MLSMRPNKSATTRDNIHVNYAEKGKSNVASKENEVQLGATDALNSKQHAQREGKCKPNAVVMKKSRTRGDVGANLGGILASLSLIDNSSNKCGTNVNTHKEKSRKGTTSRTRLSNRRLYHDMKTCHQGESRHSVVQPNVTKKTPERTEETEEMTLEVPLESSSSMILFPSLAADNNSTQSIPRRTMNIHRFASMMTPPPFRDYGNHLPSTVRIGSSPEHPSPLEDSPSPRHFSQFRNEAESPSASSTSCSRVSGVSEETEQGVEGETEEETSIEIFIYRPKRKQTRATDGCENADDGEGIEICSDEEYQQVDTDPDATEDEDLSFIVDMDEYKSDVEEGSYDECDRSKRCDGLSISDYNPDPTDSDTETEEDNSEQEIYSSKSKITQNCTFPTASTTLSTDSRGRAEDADLVQVVVIDDAASADEDTDQDKTILASVDDYSSKSEYSSDIDHKHTDNDDMHSLYSRQGKCSNSQSFTRLQDSDSLSITREVKIEPANYFLKKNSSKIRGKHVVKRGKWTLGSQIGSGTYGVVHVGMNSRTGNLMAVKSLNIPSSSSHEAIEDLQREIGLMRTLSHPNIVRYIGAETDTVKHILHIFQEWVPGGSLSSLLRKFGPFPLPVVRSYLFQIFSGLGYLHSNRILHRDIKGGNVLVNDEGIVKLADFGASKRIKLSENSSGKDMEDMMETMTMRGTPYFMAPEVFFCKYGSKADIWSSGGVAYQMCTGKAPWKDLGLRTPMSLFTYLEKHTGPPLMSKSGTTCDANGSRSSFTCKDLQDLLEECFHRDPTKRPTAYESLQHSFFTQIDPNESLIEDESVASSMVKNSLQKHCPISPISPVQIIEMKRTSANGKIQKNTLTNKRNLDSPFDTNNWPTWGKQAIVGRKSRRKKGQNPFTQN